jgi:cytochrome c biogenesis protein
VPMVSGAKPFDIEGVVGSSTELVNKGLGAAAETMTLEFTALRTINVENFAGTGAEGGVDVRKVDLRHAVESRLGAANKTVTQKELRNVGPSVTYKLRDASGQAREFHNYMLPVDTGDGVPVFLLGVRETPAEPFRFLRVPADDQGSMDGFMRMKAALADPQAREEAVRRYAAQAIDPARKELAEQLQQSAARALGLFAGQGMVDGKPTGGLKAISDFMEANVPEAERERAGEVLVRILNGTLFELAQLSRQRAGLAPLQQDDATRSFMTQSVLSLSDAQIYPAPLAFELKDFTQVQASVFQVARAPGKNIVYLGCALLILGVFAMLYVRERRVWVWLAPKTEGTDAADAASHATMALSTNRKTMDGDQEFVQLAHKLIGAPAPQGNA